MSSEEASEIIEKEPLLKYKRLKGDLEMVSCLFFRFPPQLPFDQLMNPCIDLRVQCADLRCIPCELLCNWYFWG